MPAFKPFSLWKCQFACGFRFVRKSALEFSGLNDRQNDPGINALFLFAEVFQLDRRLAVATPARDMGEGSEGGQGEGQRPGLTRFDGVVGAEGGAFHTAFTIAAPEGPLGILALHFDGPDRTVFGADPAAVAVAVREKAHGQEETTAHLAK